MSRRLLWCSALLMGCAAVVAPAQIGTAFSYQGQLRADGAPLNGTADFLFRAYSAATGGTQAGPDTWRTNVAVDDGLFTVELDFGATVFAGSPRWLETWVRSPAGSGGMTLLAPRQELTPTPYALFATTAATLPLPWTGSAASAQPTITASNTVGNALQGATSSTAVGATAVYGTATSSTGHNSGGRFFAAGDYGIGVYGRATNTGNVGNFGGYFQADGASGCAVLGYTSSTTGGNAGYFQSAGTSSIALTGRCDAASGYGVVGSCNGPGVGIYGETTGGGFAGLFAGTVRVRERLGLGSNAAADTPNRPLVIAADPTIGWPEWIGLLDPNGGPAWHINNQLGGINIVETNVADWRLFIAPGGNIGIGVSAPAYRLDLPNLANAAGRARANSWVTYSAARYKDNVQPIADALGKIGALRGVTYNWKPENGGSADVGFVAEEVREVLPEIVSVDESGVVQGLDYSRIVPVTIEAIKQLKAENDELGARLERLEGRLENAKAGE
jgi:hypothetical protein